MNFEMRLIEIVPSGETNLMFVHLLVHYPDGPQRRHFSVKESALRSWKAFRLAAISNAALALTPTDEQKKQWDAVVDKAVNFRHHD